MNVVGPGETITVSQSGIPTGKIVYLQVIKAATGSVVIGRSSTGVVERPAGSGIYVATFVSPVEADLYLVILDWSLTSTLSPSTTVSEELQVTTAAAQAETGLGEVADQLKMALGGESFKMLLDAPNYGPSFISLAIETVKARVMTVTLASVDEASLPLVCLSYLGKLAALEVMNAVYDVWQTLPQSKSVGNDPTEVVSYPQREAILNALKERLLSAIWSEQALALRLMPNARTNDASVMPAIDEDDDCKVTADPRQFPSYADFPYKRGSVVGGW